VPGIDQGAGFFQLTGPFTAEIVDLDPREALAQPPHEGSRNHEVPDLLLAENHGHMRMGTQVFSLVPAGRARRHGGIQLLAPRQESCPDGKTLFVMLEVRRQWEALMPTVVLLRHGGSAWN